METGEETSFRAMNAAQPAATAHKGATGMTIGESIRVIQGRKLAGWEIAPKRSRDSSL